MQRIGDTGFELPLEVPVSGCFIFCMHQHGPNARNVGRSGRANQSVFEQGTTQTHALVRVVNCKPGQEHDWHRVLGHTLDDTGCCNAGFHAANGKTVETYDVPGTTCDIGLGAVGFLIAKGKTLQVDVQRRLATIKCVQAIGRRQLANRFVGSCNQPSNPGSLSSCFNLGLALTG